MSTETPAAGSCPGRRVGSLRRWTAHGRRYRIGCGWLDGGTILFSRM